MKKIKKDILIVFLTVISVIIYYGYFKFKKPNLQFNNEKLILQANKPFDLIFNNSQIKKTENDYSDEEKFIAEHSNGDYLKIIADTYINEGLQNSDPGAWKRAENLLTRFLAKNQNDFEAVLSLIKTKGLLVKPEEGVALAERALKNFSEKNSELIFELGKLHEQIGNKKQARAYFNQTIEKFPPSDERVFEAYFLLARMEFQDDLHMEQINIQTAKKYLSKLIDPARANIERALGYALLAEVYGHGEHNQSQAINMAKKAIELYPQCVGCLHALGEVMLEHANEKNLKDTVFLDEAINALEKSLKKGRLVTQSYYLLGIGYWHKGEYEKAKEIWQEGLRVLPTDPFHPIPFKNHIKKQLENALANPEKLFFAE